MAEKGNERVEYRVIGERGDGTPWEGSPQTQVPNDYDFQATVRELSDRNKHVRVQKRTVTQTPWEDIK